MSFASVLSSPTIRVRIPAIHPDKDEHTYTVHRSLLKAHTNILSSSSVKPRETTCTLPATTPASSFEAILEFLYTGTYRLSESISNDEEAEEVTESSSAPVLHAAMKGAIGVWGKAPAIHDDTANRNISSYTSELFPHMRNGYGAPGLEEEGNAQFGPLPSPPASPTFSTHEPQLKPTVAKKVAKRSTPTTRLAAHLEVYELARLYEIERLIECSLENIEKEVLKCSDILQDLVRVSYRTKQRDTELKAFVIDMVSENWEQLKQTKAFSVLLKDGGEFVLDIFSKVNGL